MKRIKKSTFVIFSLLFVSFFSSCGTYSYVQPEAQMVYDNPQWAPPYYTGVRYYYFPDIETYYDLSNRVFVYLDNGQWIYSQSLPVIYAGFDLNNCFSVMVNVNTFQPWMHHQFYVSNYPRYYYRDYYDHNNIPYVRGYNENSKGAIYWSEKERGRARRWDDRHQSSDRKFKYSKPDREKQIRNENGTTRRPTESDKVGRGLDTKRNENTRKPTGNTSVDRSQPSEKSTSGRETQSTNYYGRKIGQPVKVEKQMRQPTNTGASERGNNRNANEQNKGKRK